MKSPYVQSQTFFSPPQQDSAAFLEKTDFKALWQWHAEAMFGAATSQHDSWSVRICFCVWQRLLPQPFCMHVALSCIGSLTGQYVLSPERCGGAPSSNCASNLSALLTSLFVRVSSLLFFSPLSDPNQSKQMTHLIKSEVFLCCYGNTVTPFH